MDTQKMEQKYTIKSDIISRSNGLVRQKASTNCQTHLDIVQSTTMS